MSGQSGRYQRSVAGMVGSMLILVLVVGGFIVLREANRTTPDATVKTVDYARTAEFAQDQVDFPIVQPRPLPEGWRATSVRFVPAPSSWHVGFLTDEDRYVGLEQARRSEQKMVESYVDPEAVEGDPVQVAGDTWRTWTDEGGDTALTRTEGEVTTLVVGTPGQDVLVDFASTLR